MWCCRSLPHQTFWNTMQSTKFAFIQILSERIQQIFKNCNWVFLPDSALFDWALEHPAKVFRVLGKCLDADVIRRMNVIQISWISAPRIHAKVLRHRNEKELVSRHIQSWQCFFGSMVLEDLVRQSQPTLISNVLRKCVISVDTPFLSIWKSHRHGTIVIS